MQANNAKVMSACAEAIESLIKPKEVQPKVPNGRSCKVSRFAWVVQPNLGECTGARMAEGFRLCQPKSKAKAQIKAQVAAAAPPSVQAQAQAPASKGA